MANLIYLDDNLKVLQKLEDESVDLIYVKLPKGNIENIEEYLEMLEPRFVQAHRCLTSSGALYFHSDYEIVHYCKVKLLDPIFGSRDCFVNEIIWTFEKSEQSDDKWTPKHDTILVYAKTPANFMINSENIDRIKYLAPSLVGEEKEKRGKLPTDTWWYTNIEENGKESESSSQLPLQIIKRIILASSNPGDKVLDFYARDGKVGEACLELDREFILVDKSRVALKKMAKKFKDVSSIEWVNFNPTK